MTFCVMPTVSEAFRQSIRGPDKFYFDRKLRDMRDLGKMGESAFSQWCASAGLTANGSSVDRTGWDFFVEFEFQNNPSLEFSTIHDAAFECKVQVKSTDNNVRKLGIKLSNLKRLATVPMPAFFVFIEFDGKDCAQRVFLVHVDSSLSSKILSRLHDAEQEGASDRLHKKTMVIAYDETHLLPDVSGSSLVEAMRRHMGSSMAEYVAKKNAHLNAAGFDDGFAEFTFSASGAENIAQLIDMSIGIGTHADVSDLVAFKKRFGKKSTIPFLRESNLKIEMPDLRPTAEGTVKFKVDRIGSSFSFPAKIYISPFNPSAPPELRKGRIATEFFELIFNPFGNTCTLTASIPNKGYEIRELRNGVKFLELASIECQQVYGELVIDGLPGMKFNMDSPGMPFQFSAQLAAIEAGLKVLSFLGVSNAVRISMGQATRYGSRIIEMDYVLAADEKSFRIQIPASDVTFSSDRDIVCLSFLSTPVGDVWVGVFVTIVGKPILVDNATYNVFAVRRTIERIVVREEGEEMCSEELVAATEDIEKKYESHTVVTLFDKKAF